MFPSLRVSHWHTIVFIVFLYSFPFSIRSVLALFTTRPPLVFNEYLDVSLYLSDIFLVLTLLIFILENKSLILSRMYWHYMFHVEHIGWRLIFPIFFLLWAGLSIFWAENRYLAIATFIKLVEGYFLYIYIILSFFIKNTLPYNHFSKQKSSFTVLFQKITKMFHVEHVFTKNFVPRGTILVFLSKQWINLMKCSTWNNVQWIATFFIFMGIFQSIIAILQFFYQKSLGLTFLGETSFSLYDLGIAKIYIYGDIFIRSYGLFPHPNILAGFLVISLLISVAYPFLFKTPLFHVEQFSKKWLYRGILFSQSFALLLTFSKSGFLAYGIGLFILYSKIWGMAHIEHLRSSSLVPRGTIENQEREKCSTWNKKFFMFKKIKNLFHVEQIVFLLFTTLLITPLLFAFNFQFFWIQPVMERLFLLSSLSTWAEVYWFQGVGIGNYVFLMQNFFNQELLAWQFQPIHNVFLLILSELGIVGLGIFIGFMTIVYFGLQFPISRGTYVPMFKIDVYSTWNKVSREKKLRKTRMFHMEHSLSFLKAEHRYFVHTFLLQALLVSMGIIMLFDHYLWDIQQGQFIFWIILALAALKRPY